MVGRMSVFIRLTESTPKMAINAQSTAMVYGRRSARRTIHMTVVPFDAARDGRVQPDTPTCRQGKEASAARLRETV